MDNELKKQFPTLPEELKQFIKANKWRFWVADVSRNFLLDEETKKTLLINVILVLFALLPIDEFRQTLKEETQLDDQKLDGICKRIDTEIFAPVRDILVSITSPEDEGGVEITNDQPTDQEQGETDESRDQILQGVEQPETILPEVPPQDLPATAEDNDLIASYKMTEQTHNPRQEESGVSTNYKGQDPYREPIE